MSTALRRASIPSTELEDIYRAVQARSIQHICVPALAPLHIGIIELLPAREGARQTVACAHACNQYACALALFVCAVEPSLLRGYPLSIMVLPLLQRNARLDLLQESRATELGPYINMSMSDLCLNAVEDARLVWTACARQPIPWRGQIADAGDRAQRVCAVLQRQDVHDHPHDVLPCRKAYAETMVTMMSMQRASGPSSC